MTDGERTWTVEDEISRNTHPPDGNRWRVGEVTARATPAREVGPTLEGPVTDRAGHWVVQGEGASGGRCRGALRRVPLPHLGPADDAVEVKRRS